MQAMSAMNVYVVWFQFKKALEKEEPLDVVDKIIKQNLLVLEQRFEPLGFTSLLEQRFDPLGFTSLDFELSGLTPLNYVCRLAAFDVIERLSDSSQLCQYLLAETSSTVRFDVIERLVERFPKALTIADNNGYLPLHNICRCSSVPLDLVQLFVSKFPDSVKAITSKCGEDKTPLYLAVENSALSLDVIQFLYDQYPEAALQKIYWGQTPLHNACYRSRDVIKLLVELCPEALTVTDDDGSLPLHLICSSKLANLDLIQLFVNNFPESVKAKTIRNYTPLHIAVCWCLSLDVIEFIYELYPEAALQQNNYGLTPLHAVCGRTEFNTEDKPTILTITKFLYAACPKAARIQGYEGLTPFHNSCVKNNETAVQFLLEKDPALIVAMNEQDNSRWKELYRKSKYSFDEMKKALSENSQIYECVQSAALALVGELVIKNKTSLSEIEPNVIAEHLAKILETRPIPTFQQLHSPITTDEIIRVCTKQKVYDDLETLLYTPTFQTLLKGYRNMIHIDQSGFLWDDPGNKAKYIAVLAATAGVNANNSYVDNNSEDDDDDGSNDYESDSNENNSDADNNGDDNNSEDDNNNNKDDNNNNNKDDNNYGNVHLLFQQLRANTLLCKRLS